MAAKTNPLSGRPVITVTDHALTRARARFRNDKLERESIKESVRAGIDSGRVFTQKPKAFTLYGKKQKHLPSHQRCVLAPDGSKAWIVALDKPGEIVVVTSLSRAWAAAA